MSGPLDNIIGRHNLRLVLRACVAMAYKRTEFLANKQYQQGHQMTDRLIFSWRLQKYVKFNFLWKQKICIKYKTTSYY